MAGPTGDYAYLEVDGIHKAFGSNTVLDDVSLSVRPGEFFALLGPSGGGKTTLLMMIAGFVAADQGVIKLDGSDLASKSIQTRGTAIVFQNYALFPHMTVRANVAFGLKRRKLSKKEVTDRVNEALEMVSLQGMQDRYPSQLSGGQQQRVALARAVVVRPKLLLLDEPLSNLDARLRQQLGREIKQLQRRTGVTTVFVTHDLEEAFALSDSVAVVADGSIRQVGSPRELYEHPASKFVADFVGHENVLDCLVLAVDQDGGALVDSNGAQFAIQVPDVQVGQRLSVSVPAHAIRARPAPGPGETGVQATMNDAAVIGGKVRVTCRFGDNGSVLNSEMMAEDDGVLDLVAMPAGSSIALHWPIRSAIVIGDEASV